MIKVREVEDTDLTPLAEFLPKGFPYTIKEFWPPLFELWWTLNPAYTPETPKGWILEKDQSIVGFIGNIPVRFQVGSTVRIAASSNSWYVDPSVRGIFSFILFNAYLKQKSASLFLFKGEDNQHIMNILSKYKFKEQILPVSQTEYVYIIDKKKVNSIVKTYLLNNQLPKLSQLWEYTRRAGFLLSAYVYQKSVTTRGDPHEETYTSSLCTSCDDAFSDLWEPDLNPSDTTLSRDLKTLNWLYFSSARLYKRVVIQCHRSHNNTLAGYMVFDIIQKKTTDIGSMHLMDICIEKNNPQVLASLISYAIEFGKRCNAALLIIWANSPETETYLRNTITMRRTSKHYRYVRLSEAPDMKSSRDNYDTVCLPMIYPPQ